MHQEEDEDAKPKIDRGTKIIADYQNYLKMLDKQMVEVDKELRVFDYLKLFRGNFNLIEEQDKMIHSLNLQLQTIMDNYGYNKYLLTLEQHLSDKHRYDCEQAELKFEEALSNY